MNFFGNLKWRKMRKGHQGNNDLLSEYSSKMFLTLSFWYLIQHILEVSLNYQKYISEFPQKFAILLIFGLTALTFTVLNKQRCSKALDRLLKSVICWKFFLIEAISAIYVISYMLFELRSKDSSNLTNIPEITKGINIALFLISIIRVAQGWIFKSILVTIPVLYMDITTATQAPGALYIGVTSIPIVCLVVVLNYFEDRFYKRQYQLQTQELEFWKRSLNKTNDGVLMLEEQNKVTYINDACKKIFAKYGNALNGNEMDVSNLNLFGEIEILESTNFQDIPNFHEQRSFNLTEFLKALRQRLRKADNRHERADNHIMTLETRVQVLDAENLSYQIKVFSLNFEGASFFLLTFADITLQKTVFELKKKSEFNIKILASVTHELRTPLNGSLNFIQYALDNDRIPADIKAKALMPARRSNLLLLNLVNDILDFSRIKAEKIKFNIENKNLIDTLKEAVELVELQAKRKNIQINLLLNDLEPDLDFATDHQRVKQIILNLLSNSVKFTQKGSVTLSIENFKQQPSSQQGLDRILKLCVTDTGVGISEADQTHLFQEYTQVGGESQRRNMNPNGMGLGLNIANTLARHLGPAFSMNSAQPALKLSSKLDEGSSFYFLIEEKEVTELDSHHSQQSHQSPALDPVFGTPTSRVFDASILTVRHSEDSPILNQSTISRPSQFVRKYCNTQKTPPMETSKMGDRYPFNEKHSDTSEALASRLSKYHFTTSPKFQTQKKNYLQQLVTEEQSSEVVRKSCECVRVLVVDDDSFNLIASEMIFSGLKTAIDTAFNGKEAIEKILSKNAKSNCSDCKVCGGRYSVVFMDISMPIMDGETAAIELKKLMKETTIHHVSIVACSAVSQSVDVMSNFDEECVKPLVKARVLEILEKFDFQVKRRANSMSFMA